MRAPLRFDGEWFELRLSATPKAAQHFQRWFMDEGAAWLRSRSSELERLSGQTSSKVIVRDLGFRWGSCGKNRTLYFNWRLLQLPVQVIDYVVLHEQVHLLHHNHSQQFWKAMDSVLPDWPIRKEELERDWGRFARFALAATPLGTAGGERITSPTARSESLSASLKGAVGSQRGSPGRSRSNSLRSWASSLVLEGVISAMKAKRL